MITLHRLGTNRTQVHNPGGMVMMKSLDDEDARDGDHADGDDGDDNSGDDEAQQAPVCLIEQAGPSLSIKRVGSFQQCALPCPPPLLPPPPLLSQPHA